ncbi:conserved hypothetical protein [Sporisorium reilianum SRZ2]|uniref:Uncharacterized protein n=1 Tax=Sporisorium reilianum (strain SRZ2) TaxID=999809 RepID=E6ZS72_SPORE|nr:conserved hypothetical protein [Sporisorium reilianum SRZ2]
MREFGKELPLIRLSQVGFPFSKQVLAFPLRQPHGQGGPGTTLAIVVQDGKGGFNLIDFSHIQGVAPDNLAHQLSFLRSQNARQITSLGNIASNLESVTVHILP